MKDRTDKPRDLGSALQRWRTDFPLPEDPYTEEETAAAERLLRVLYEADDRDIRELAIHFPIAWNRILPLAYELIAREDLRKLKLHLFSLMRQQMTGQLRRALWLYYQKNYPDDALGDFVLPYLAEQNDHYRGQPDIARALSHNLHRLSSSRILPNPQQGPEILEAWAESFDLDLTQPLGANILGESALLWQTPQYRQFGAILFRALPAMDPLLGAQLLRTAFSPLTLTPDLQLTAFRAMRPTYDSMNSGVTESFWTHSDRSLKHSFSRWVVKTECEYQFSDSPVKERLLYPLESEILHIQRLNDDILVMDLGSHLIVDSRQVISNLMLIDKDTMRRLLEQGRTPEQIVENLQNARLREEDITQSVLKGRWRLGLTGFMYGLTQKALAEITGSGTDL